MAALLRALRMAEATDQVAVLLSRRPADHAHLDHPDGIAALLHELRMAGATDEVTVLLSRRSADNAPLAHPNILVELQEVKAQAHAANLHEMSPDVTLYQPFQLYEGHSEQTQLGQGNDQYLVEQWDWEDLDLPNDQATYRTRLRIGWRGCLVGFVLLSHDPR